MRLRAIGVVLLLWGLSVVLGRLLGICDLLHRGGYRWFRGAPVACATAAALLCWSLLALGHATLSLWWVALASGWAAAGALRGPGRWSFAAAAAAFFVAQQPLRVVDPYTLPYFLLTVGLTSAAIVPLRRSTGRVAVAATALLRRRYHWYASALGYCLLFELDPALCLVVHGCASGVEHLSHEAHRDRLRSIGIRKGPAA